MKAKIFLGLLVLLFICLSSLYLLKKENKENKEKGIYNANYYFTNKVKLLTALSGKIYMSFDKQTKNLYLKKDQIDLILHLTLSES